MNGRHLRKRSQSGAARTLILGVALAAQASAYARGEWWIAKPSDPPPAATLTNEARYIEWKWRTDVTDPKTGVDRFVAGEKLLTLSKELEPHEPWCVVKAKCYAWLCDNIAIAVSPLDWYPAVSLWDRYKWPMRPVVWRRNGEIESRFYPEISQRVQQGNQSGLWSAWKDFDHTIPDWDDVIRIGFPGMKKRLRDHWRDEPYYRACDIVADASLRLVRRFVDYAKASPNAASPRMRKVIASLERLATGAPQTAYDVMQFIYLYFVMSEHMEAIQCRSLSIIDKTLWPYYQADLAAGRTTEAEFREQFRHFLWQWGSIDNYWGQPVTMGGTKADGTTEYNPLSLVILDVMDECALPTPKFHLKIAMNTPDAVLRKALDMARRHRPLSFLGEAPVRRVLEGMGYTPDEARRFCTTGCYEFCVPGNGNGHGGGHANLLKQVELLLADAKDGRFDAGTFEDFKAEYLRRAENVCDEVLKIYLTYDLHLDDVNPSNLGSLAGEYSVRTGKNVIADGTPKGNGTGICVSGFGTTVDALMAVREIVYERREMSLADLGRLMADDWKGRDDLRLRMLRSKRKWGNNDPEANAIGRELSKRLSARINGKVNPLGGGCAMSGHNALTFVWEGQRTGATPDGRRKGEEFSKNLSPTMGVDTEGVTALISTLAVLDSRDFPGDFPLDVMLLPYTVAGDKGLETMKALLFQYYANNGIMMQFNVFDAEELKDAQKHPEKYENLQVRVCGWNVRWNDLPKVEQDAYIRRAEAIAR